MRIEQSHGNDDNVADSGTASVAAESLGEALAGTWCRSGGGATRGWTEGIWICGVCGTVYGEGVGREKRDVGSE